MNYTLSRDNLPLHEKTTEDMREGDIAVITSGTYAGSIILCTYNCFINLNNPKITWVHGVHISIRDLPSKYKVTLTIN
jgi:hypothetical protein